ncbi:MAG: UPF0182 family protein, partial [Micrococcales bacterium]|nr:UPF0182 family protein [Micrococcales bacterium]
AGALREDAETTNSIRLLDPTVVSPTFRQREGNKPYYGFPDFLAVDRYELPADGKLHDTVIAVRDIQISGIGGDSTWVKKHTVYTHGYGVAAAYGNKTDYQGWPVFFEGGIPIAEDDVLNLREPRVYFGTTSPEYSIVGGPDGSEEVELDYPYDTVGGGNTEPGEEGANQSESAFDPGKGQVNTTFKGDGGPKVGAGINRLLYALRFASTDILFSSYVNSESQILYDRDPQTRVKKVAPYLTLDERTYPAVVDGRIVWIVDAYTTTDYYPYAQHQTLSTATLDSVTARGSDMAGISLMGGEQVNYIRNSVKAVVDAYDGKVTLYAWDTEDPVLKAWASIYSNTLTPVSEISGDLMAHLRYPESLFKVQRTVLEKYHVEDAINFYGGQDFWAVPKDPTKPVVVQQPPFYLTLKMPNQSSASFSLSTGFIPFDSGANTRQILKGFFAVDSETGNSPGKVADGYGKMRLLRLPQGSSVPGPTQVQNNFDSDSTVKGTVRWLQDLGTDLIKGNLLTLPVGGGLLYVQPMYVQATNNGFPSVQYVVVGFNDKVRIAPTLDGALNLLFGGDPGAEAGDADVVKEEQPPLDPGEEGDGEPTDEEPPVATEQPATTQPAPTTQPPPTGIPDLDQALADAQKAMDDSAAALQNGDWAAYGRAQDALRQALAQAQAARDAGKT